MATVTPNFNWPVPTSTDLVKDGATAIEALGDSIDASMVDLKGGTTGQILSKASNTDMDFSWTTPNPGDITGVTAGTGISGGGTSGDVTITNSMATAIDAKGDLVAGTADNTFSRLAVGTNGQVLTADSTAATGLKWSTSASSSGPLFRAYRTSSNQSFSQNTWTKVQLNAVSYNPDSCFDYTTNYRFTPTKAGYYQFNASLYVNKTGASTSAGAIYLNGAKASTIYEWTNTSTYFIMGNSDILYLNGSTDYAELYVYDADPSARNVAAESPSSFFSGTWIRS